jgi:uncharacterized protein DUF4232
VRSGLAWAAVMIVLATACRGQGHWAAYPSAPSAQTTCNTADLRLSAGPDLSPATGMNPRAIRITNMGARCILAGYPALRFTNAMGAQIPLTLSRTGDQMVTAHRPHAVTVARGSSAWIVLNKYRCDVGDRTAVRGIVVRLPGAGRVGAMHVDDAGWAYCGSGDPGSTVHVSPFEPRLLAALRQGQ